MIRESSMNIKSKLQIATRLTVRQFLKLFWILPVHKNRILFESYGGTAYSCNPKYLSEYLEATFPENYKLVWSFEQPEHFSDLTNDHHVYVIKKRSIRWYYEYFTAGIRVTNVATQMTFFPKRRHQLVINTWHAGGAYKRTGIISEYVQESNDFQKWRRRQQAGQFDLFLSSSPVFTNTNIRAAYGYNGNVLNSGMPRNDLLFDADRVRNSAKKVRTQFGITGFIVLYAPTYRGKSYQSEPLPPFPLEEVMTGIKKRYGLTPTLLIRAHYTDRNSIISEGNPNLIDATQYPDMQELLCAADLLITDYSSSIWDFALLGRPSLLYVPDLEKYETADRGFFTPINDWPGIVCRDAAALYDALCNLDEEACREKAKKHLEQFQSYECGKACEMTEQAIRKFIQTGELT